MCRALVVTAIAVLPSLAPWSGGTQPPVVSGEAAAVDGDTLLVDGHRVRISALHAPEADEPGGAAAKNMAALVVYGERVVCTVVDTDRSGGLVADCVMFSDGADFAEVMIRAGYGDHCPAFGRPDLAFLPKNGFELPTYCAARRARPLKKGRARVSVDWWRSRRRRLALNGSNRRRDSGYCLPAALQSVPS